MDDAGKFPAKLKRGVLSQDGIWNIREEQRTDPEKRDIRDPGA